MGMPGGAQGEWTLRRSGKAKGSQTLVPLGWKLGTAKRKERLVAGHGMRRSPSFDLVFLF